MRLPYTILKSRSRVAQPESPYSILPDFVPFLEPYDCGMFDLNASAQRSSPRGRTLFKNGGVLKLTPATKPLSFPLQAPDPTLLTQLSAQNSLHPTLFIQLSSPNSPYLTLFNGIYQKGTTSGSNPSTMRFANRCARRP